jgi:hypothetical protein
VTAEGLEVAALVAAVAKTEVPVAARADAWLRWTTTGWDVAAAKGTGDVPQPSRGGERVAAGDPVEAEPRASRPQPGFQTQHRGARAC